MAGKSLQGRAFSELLLREYVPVVIDFVREVPEEDEFLEFFLRCLLRDEDAAVLSALVSKVHTTTILLGMDFERALGASQPTPKLVGRIWEELFSQYEELPFQVLRLSESQVKLGAKHVVLLIEGDSVRESLPVLAKRLGVDIQGLKDFAHKVTPVLIGESKALSIHLSTIQDRRVGGSVRRPNAQIPALIFSAPHAVPDLVERWNRNALKQLQGAARIASLVGSTSERPWYDLESVLVRDVPWFSLLRKVPEYEQFLELQSWSKSLLTSGATEEFADEIFKRIGDHLVLPPASTVVDDDALPFVPMEFEVRNLIYNYTCALKTTQGRKYWGVCHHCSKFFRKTKARSDHKYCPWTIYNTTCSQDAKLKESR